MINREDWIMIKDLRSRGCFIKDIAHKYHCSPKTISRTLKRQGPPPKRKSGVCPGKLDPFKPMVDRCLAEDIWNAEVIFAKIAQQGYTGSRTLLRDYIQPKRVMRKSLATTRYETEPGHQLQHDWGEVSVLVGGTLQKVYFSVNTLGYSRRFFVWAALKNDAEHTYESLVRSFEWFGGATDNVLVDNQKAAVISHPANGKPVFNEGFLMLAEHYGFTPKACKPYRPQTKGKTERMVRYTKENFFQRYRQFESLTHLNQQLEQWLIQVADQRIHGTVQERVSTRFTRETTALKRLPRTPFDTSYFETRKVPVDCYIDVLGNRYSVPSAQVHQTVRIRIGLDRQLRIYDTADQPVATHLLRDGKNEWACDRDHHQPLYQAVHVETRDLSQYEGLA